MHHTSSSPNDEDDSAPFLMSRVIQRDGWHRGDISTITSPCFEAEKQSRSKSPIGSLFSRLSRGLRVDNSKPGHGKGSPATPATPKSPNGFESISTIKAEGSIVGIENEVNTRGKTANSAGFAKISQRDHNYDRHAFPGSQNESMPDLLRELAGLSVSDGRLSGDVTRDSSRSESFRHVGRVRQQDGMVSDNSHRNSPDEMEFATGRSAATTYSIPSRSNSASPEESILQGRSSQSRLKNFFPSSQDVPAIHYRKQHSPGKEDLQNSACSFEKKLDPKFIAEPFSRKQQHTINNSNESSTHEVNSPLRQRIHHVNFDSKTSREMLCPIQLKTDDSKSGKKNADCMKTTNSLSDERSTTASQSFDKSADTQSIRSENEWREVIDPESGCKYYYNRKTRISKWRLPKGAILAKPRKSSRSRISNSKIQIHSAIKSGVQHHESLFPTVSKTVVQNRSSKSYNPNNSMLSAESSSSNKESPMNMIHRSITSKPCLATTSTTRTKSDAKTRSVAHFMSPQDNANESTNAEGQSRRSIFYLKSPQDCKSGDSIVFCLYCGLKCQSAAILGSHLAQCIHFSRMQGQEHLSAHIEIEKALFIAWSKIDCTYKATVNNVTEKKSNPFDQNDRSYSGVSSYSQDSSQFCHPSPESAAVISSDPSAKDRCFETSVNEYISYSNAPDDSQNRIQNIANDFNIDTKKCPFCSKNFTQGNHLSGHLLNCSERRRLRKQRRSKTRGNCSLVERRNKNTTPGRKMPWE